ncbi:MAG TPA: hypothetical protein VKV20_19980 [Ktedonobacteraceae bacterium]|nr:hypothetical protein [Ktedonobacteraceae bacterium]
MSGVVDDAVIKEQTFCSISNSPSILHLIVTLVATSTRVTLVYNDGCFCNSSRRSLNGREVDSEPLARGGEEPSDPSFFALILGLCVY